MSGSSNEPALMACVARAASSAAQSDRQLHLSQQAAPATPNPTRSSTRKAAGRDTRGGGAGVGSGPPKRGPGRPPKSGLKVPSCSLPARWSAVVNWIAALKRRRVALWP